MRGERSIKVAASPDHVYAVVSDMTRMGEFSPECHRVEWLEGASGPACGARFIGHNRGGPISWSREGRVVTAEPGVVFAFVTEWRGHDSTRWTYRLDATKDGTTLTESYELLWAPWWMRAVDHVTFRRRQLDKAMSQTLSRIKQRVESLSAGTID